MSDSRIADIHARAAAIEARFGTINWHRSAVKATVRSPNTKQWKITRLVEIADEAMKVVAPSTACKRGCSACCHIALPIALSKAKELSALTGRHLRYHIGKIASVKGIDKDVARFKGVPCPFLVNDECSVYEARPIQCRVHHVIEADAVRCEPHQTEEKATS